MSFTIGGSLDRVLNRTQAGEFHEMHDFADATGRLPDGGTARTTRGSRRGNGTGDVERNCNLPILPRWSRLSTTQKAVVGGACAVTVVGLAIGLPLGLVHPNAVAVDKLPPAGGGGIVPSSTTDAGINLSSALAGLNSILSEIGTQTPTAASVLPIASLLSDFTHIGGVTATAIGGLASAVAGASADAASASGIDLAGAAAAAAAAAGG